MSGLFLLDASITSLNAINLKFVELDGRISEFFDDQYKPYFLTSNPIGNEDKHVMDYSGGEAAATEKTDLFTGERGSFFKVSWPNVKVASKAADRFHVVWESEVNPAKSYVYDKGLVFGAMHARENLEPILRLPSSDEDLFERTFGDIRRYDASKHAQIAHWFSILRQPIPTLNSAFWGSRDVDREAVHSAWMLSRIANLPLLEAYDSHRVSDWLKSIIYTCLRRNNVLIPTAEEFTRRKPIHTVTGALTVAPKAGIYFNTVVCDFESLYPSCIDSFNLSYETVNCGHRECLENSIPEFDGYICKKRRGFYSTLIGALKDLRIRLFKPASKNNTTAEEKQIASTTAKLLKLISVSSYGVTVRIHGLACPPLAEAITGYGRHVLGESWRMAEEKGLHPLYGDTDSLFLDNVSDEQVNWLIEAIKEKFHLDLAVEKRYSLCALPKAKKAYFGIFLNGTPDIKGVTAIKSNSPGYIRKVFQKCVEELRSVKNLNDYERATERIHKNAQKATADLRSRKVDLADLAYSVRLFFDPNNKAEEMQIAHQPYQCAVQLIDSGRKLGRGDTVSFVKVKAFKYKGKTFTVKPFEFVATIAEINTEDYARNLLTALNQTLGPMGIKLQTQRDTEISRWLANGTSK